MCTGTTRSNHHSTHDRHSPSASVPSHVHCRRIFCHMCHGRIVCAAAQASAFNTASIPDSITTGSKHDTFSAVTVTQPARPRPSKYRQVLRSSAKSSAYHSRHASPREANTTRVHANRLCSCRIGVRAHSGDHGRQQAASPRKANAIPEDCDAAVLPLLAPHKHLCACMCVCVYACTYACIMHACAYTGMHRERERERD